jgi:hypothetical protein
LLRFNSLNNGEANQAFASFVFVCETTLPFTHENTWHENVFKKQGGG